MNRDLKKVIYYIFIFGASFGLSKMGQFNLLSFGYGMLSVYLGRWCYRG